jgi:hypothetical protein
MDLCRGLPPCRLRHFACGSPPFTPQEATESGGRVMWGTAHGAFDARKFRDGSGIVDGGCHAEDLRSFQGFLWRAHAL